MLQQTQVATVIPYFTAFMDAFPSVHHLANADLDDVLHLWTGLGYYARARNLHKTAHIISVEQKGVWPQSLSAVSSLPGIGRSTAGAILSLGMGIQASILDGNVKRVLSRVHSIAGWPGSTATQKELWLISEHYTPKKRTAHYNQALMDLGATLCTRSKPACFRCPLRSLCSAHIDGTVSRYPEPKPKKVKPTKRKHLLMLTHRNSIWLEQRPTNGIWGGLWSFPEFDSLALLEQFCSNHPHIAPNTIEEHELRRHTFSHYHLDYTPTTVMTNKRSKQINETRHGEWFAFKRPIQVGLAAPVQQLIEALKRDMTPVT